MYLWNIRSAQEKRFESPRLCIQISKWRCEEIGDRAKGSKYPWKRIRLSEKEKETESKVGKKIRIPYTKYSNPLSRKVKNKPRTHWKSESSQEGFESILEDQAFVWK